MKGYTPNTSRESGTHLENALNENCYLLHVELLHVKLVFLMKIDRFIACLHKRDFEKSFY